MGRMAYQRKELKIGPSLSLLLRYALKAAALILVIISLNFVLIHLMPGDPIMHILGEEQYYALTNQFPERLEEVKRNYSLDGSLLSQYLRFMYNVITFRFGQSYIDGTSVTDNVFFRLRWTLTLSLCAIVISALVGGALGVVAGYKKGGKTDSVLTAFFLLLETIPANCLALIMLVIFSFKLRWFPVGGMTSAGVSGWAKTLSILQHMILPVAVLSLYRTAANFLLMKSYVSQIRDEDYMTVAVSKGLKKSRVLFVHLMKNAMVPYVTTLCMQMGHIISGSMLIEVVFSWKGMGTLIYDAVMSKDYPTIQMCFLLIAGCVVLFNFVADVLCMQMDPRIRDGMAYE